MRISVLVPVRDDPRVDDLLESLAGQVGAPRGGASRLIGWMPMGPVWRLVRGEKDMCHRCGREIVDYPAVGRVVDFQFHPEAKYCWDCYRYVQPFVDEIAPASDDPYQPVTKPAIP